MYLEPGNLALTSSRYLEYIYLYPTDDLIYNVGLRLDSQLSSHYSWFVRLARPQAEVETIPAKCLSSTLHHQTHMPVATTMPFEGKVRSR